MMSRLKLAGAGWLLASMAVVIGGAVALAQPRVATTKNDFYFRGTQPRDPGTNNPPAIGGQFEALVEAGNCQFCHGNLGDEASWPDNQAPYERWRYSMMAQSFRDPIFHTQLHIAEKDATGSSDACIRCHAPQGWLQNRSSPPDANETFFPTDTDGVSCSVCHRSLDPDNKPGAPTPDLAILQGLGADRPVASNEPGLRGTALAQGHLVLDPLDRRRGPFDLGADFPYHPWLQSQWHRESNLCITCHDISNPALSRQPDGSYVFNALNTPHPTGNKYDMYPLDRTGSEWAMSQFAAGPVSLTIPNPNGPGTTGRYGDAQTSYSSCQDCHMPKTAATGCNPGFGRPIRPDYPQHNFQGGNTWALKAVADLFNPLDSQLNTGPGEEVLDVTGIDESIERNKEMLRRASDLEVTTFGGKLRTRIINESGHRLPGGFAEGTVMWVNVKFFNASNALIEERGAYDPATAVLTRNTKVYEAKAGLDAHASLVTGLPVGPSFHLDLNNKMFFDNRIPPRGFTNANFQAIQAPPVGYTYADGQHWDDTLFDIPAGTARAEVRVMYQTTSKEYIEFLRDNAQDKPANASTFIKPPPGSTATTLGGVVYEQWVKWGRSTPVQMDLANLPTRRCVADLAGANQAAGADGVLTADDIIVFLGFYFASDPIADVAGPNQSSGADGVFTADDIIVFLGAFFAGCP